jgi:hypothetical protein
MLAPLNETHTQATTLTTTGAKIGTCNLEPDDGPVLAIRGQPSVKGRDSCAP